MRNIGIRIAILMAIGGWNVAAAHHSPAAFDTSTEVTLEGTVTEFSWKNPHVYLTIETVGADGNPIMQRIEGGPASSVITMGGSPTVLSIGEPVLVRANPNRRGPGHTALGLTVTKADGSAFALRFGQLAAPTPESTTVGLGGQWLPAAADFAVLAASRLSWPFTEAGRTAADDVATIRATSADCKPFGTPAVMITPTLNSIDLGTDRIVIDNDATGTPRIVHLDVARPPPGIEPTHEGYSVGRWEQSTLVIETTAFAPDPAGLGFALPSGAGKRVVERLTLSDDSRHLLYEATVEDPEYLREPVQLQSTWSYRPDLEPAGLECDAASAAEFLRD
jgi:Family of unknown function (DUF6152)